MVISGMLYMAAALVGLLLALAGIDFLLSPAKTLRITLFHPYRRDEWPQGVQEENSVRFDLSGPRLPAPPIVPSWDEIRVASDAEGAAAATSDANGSAQSRIEESTLAAIEESTTESVVVEPLHAEVHRAPH